MSVEISITDQIVEINEVSNPVEISVSAGAAVAQWGSITGTLSNQTDLQNALNLKVPYTGATANVDLGEFELKAGQIEYDQTPTGVAGVAVTRWNDSTGTIETTLKGGSVVLEHGRDMFERVVNKTGIQLTKAAYQAVRVSNAQGQRLAVQLAQANNDNNSADTIGLVVETIDNNQEGYIYTVGEIDGVNTTGTLQGETWVDGDVLYLSPTTAGRITNVKPIAPQHLVIIGYVIYAHQNNGKIYVKVMNGWELGELHDVDTTGATNGQVLKYNGTIWTPSTDVGITGSGVSGQVSYWNGTNTQTGSNNLFWDAANNRLGVGTNTPSVSLDINGIAKIQNIRIDGSNLDNTFIGKNTWASNTGLYNTFIGSGAGNNNTSGYAGTFLGYNAGVANTTGIANTFIGYQSGIINTTGTGNTFLGVDAGYGNVASNYNVIIGFHAGLHADVSENVLIGADTAQTLGFSGLGSVYVGYRTGFSATTANYNTFIGSLAGFSVTTGDNLTLIGREAGQALTSGSDTTIIGYRAGFNQTAADGNTMLGSFSGFSNAAGNQNTYVGKEAAFYVTTGNNNTISGFRSGYNITTGSDNTFIGAFSGSSVSQLVSASNSVAIGYNAFTSASNQVVIGNASITHNILYGNLLLGSTTNGTQRLQVTGDVNFGGTSGFNWDNTNGRLGIGTNAPSKTFDVNGEALIRDTLNVTSGITKGINFASTRLSEPTNSSTFTQFLIQPSLGNKASVFQIAPSGTSTATAIEVYSNSGLNSADRFVFKNTTGLLQIGADGASLPLSFMSNNINQLYMFANGNVRLQNGGTFTDSGQRLQVTGDTLLKGSGNTSATTALTVQNSDGVGIYSFRNDGQLIGIIRNAQTEPSIRFTQVTANNNNFVYVPLIAYENSGATQRGVLSGAYGGTGQAFFRFSHAQQTNGIEITLNRPSFDNNTGNTLNINQGFAPTSGANTWSQLLIGSTINQTGGANGITRGLYVNPTLTAAADWRSIEWSNNTGWGLYGAGTSANYLAGSLGIGSTSLTGKTLVISKNITGSTIPDAVLNNGVIQSDATNSTNYFITNASTAAASFTITNVRHYISVQGTIGAGSTVTNQFGYFAHSSMTGATNNYGFYGDIASGTGRWNLYMNGTANNFMAGSLGIGSTTLTGFNFRMGKNIEGALTSYGAAIVSTVQSGVTNGARVFYTEIGTQAASFTLSELSHYYSVQGSIGAGSSVLSQYGFRVHENLTGATNNYGFYGNIAAATGRWNFYANGSAANYFNGNTIMGTLSADSGEKLQVNGTMKVTGASTFGGNMTLSLNQNANTSFSVSNTTSGTSSMATINLISNGGTQAVIGKYSSTTTPYKTILSNDFSIYNNPSFGDISILNDNTSGSIKFAAGGSSTAQWTIGSNGDLTAADGENIIVGTTNGTKLGTATSQKIGFWNATPIVQPTTAVAEATFVENSGGTAVNVDSTFDGYTMQQVVKALRNAGLLA